MLKPYKSPIVHIYTFLLVISIQHCVTRQDIYISSRQFWWNSTDSHPDCIVHLSPFQSVFDIAWVPCYRVAMIQSFKNQATEDIFDGKKQGCTKALSARFVACDRSKTWSSWFRIYYGWFKSPAGESIRSFVRKSWRTT